MKSTRRAKNQESQLGPRIPSNVSLKSNNAEPEQTQQPGDLDWLPAKTLLKPVGQLQLTEQELSEEFTRILNANNPRAPHNISRFNHKEKVFKSIVYNDHLVVHFEFDGYLIYKDEEESNENDLILLAAESDEIKKKAVIRNQFNFIERAAQTFNHPSRVFYINKGKNFKHRTTAYSCVFWCS